MSFRLHCGCGTVLVRKTLTKEVNCDRCGWPLVYASGSREYHLTRHTGLTVLAPAPTKPKAKR
jgi:hypothetical protein